MALILRRLDPIKEEERSDPGAPSKQLFPPTELRLTVGRPALSRIDCRLENILEI